METHAFGNLMDKWKEDPNFIIKGLTTDKNSAILSKVATSYPHIQHGLDKWHVLKNIKKAHMKVLSIERNVSKAYIGDSPEEKRQTESPLSSSSNSHMGVNRRSARRCRLCTRIGQIILLPFPSVP